MTLLRSPSRPPHPVMAAAASWRSGLARSVAVAIWPQTPEAPDPLTLDHRLDAATALRLLASEGQGLAFVATGHGRTSVVSAGDLRFATEWAGSRATVADAVTQGLVDLHANEKPADFYADQIPAPGR